MGDRDYYRKDFMKPKSVFQLGAENSVISLIIIQLIVYALVLALWVISIVIFDSGTAATDPFESNVLGNLFVPAVDTLYKPWTLFTYMFVHYGFWSILSSVLWLLGFGQIFQVIAGSDKVYPVFIYGGLAGAVVFMLSSFLLGNHVAPQLMGAGTGIMCMAIATTVLSPNYRIFPMLGNGIPLWVLTLVFVAIDLSAVSYGTNTLLAHIAAGGMGYMYVVLLKQGKDIGAWMGRSVNWFLELFNPQKKYNGKEGKTHYYQATKEPYVKKPNLTQQKLDEILDKINQHGYESLTDAEKAFLKKASENL